MVFSETINKGKQYVTPPAFSLIEILKIILFYIFKLNPFRIVQAVRQDFLFLPALVPSKVLLFRHRLLYILHSYLNDFISFFVFFKFYDVNRDTEKGLMSYFGFFPEAISAKVSPTSGAILKPWPEKPAAITSPGCSGWVSRIKSESGVN